MTDDDFRLYLFIRQDMKSMTLGRVAAQAHHAGSVFTRQMENLDNRNQLKKAYNNWKDNIDFGTVIVLSLKDVNDMIEFMTIVFRNDENVLFDWKTVTDPSYRIQDGNYAHYTITDTCYMLFCSKRYYDKAVAELEEKTGLTFKLL